MNRDLRRGAERRETMIDAAQPFLKWAGGKRAISTEILKRLPTKISTYYEPFIGGGAVFFALASEKRFDRAVIGDANLELMNAYTMAAAQPAALIDALRRHAIAHCEAYYYKIRALEPSTMAAMPRAARIIYLNRTCFNGLYRVNSKGAFNVPFGAYANPTICNPENLRAVSATLAGVEFSDRDFADTVALARKGDAVYFDCPYWPVSESSNFTGYTKGGFTSNDQTRLRDVALRLKKKCVHVLLSNADVPPVRALYANGFKIEPVSAPRRINSKGANRGSVGELLIT